MSNPSPTPLQSHDDGSPVLEWRGEHEGFVRFLPGSDFPVEGRVHLALTSRGNPLTLPNAWHDKPMASLTVRRLEDFGTLYHALDRVVQQLPVWRGIGAKAETVWRVWNLPPLKDDWDANVDQLSVALLPPEKSSSGMFPALASAIHESSPSQVHPLAGLTSDQPTIPYEWSGEPGMELPLLGSGFSLHLGQANGLWITATSENQMNGLAESLTQGSAEQSGVDAVLHLSWANCLRPQWAVEAAKLELIPGMNGDDASHDLVPVLSGLSNLNDLVLRGSGDAAWLKISGSLVHPAPSSASAQ